MSELPSTTPTLDVEAAVRRRYGDAAQAREAVRCCPVAYDEEGACLDQKHAVVYRGPWRQVQDDDGHVLRRGVRTAVCEKTFGIDAREPYRGHLDLVPPSVHVPLAEAPVFPCNIGPMRRDPRETKGDDYQLTTEAGLVCKPGDCC